MGNSFCSVRDNHCCDSYVYLCKGATMGRTGRPNLIHYAIGDSA